MTQTNSDRKNILFIMCDQLRWDYLSCYGHPHLHTPNIDSLAARGIRFDRAYVNNPLCCPSRASFYTGRYCSSHGASINFSAMRPDELTLGDYLEPLGIRTALTGKTHSFLDTDGIKRLGIDPDSEVATRIKNAGFEPYWRDDGLHPHDARAKDIQYNQYLRGEGYDNINPWQANANGAIDENGDWVNGWLLRSGEYSADIAEPHSESPYATRQAMSFIEDAGDQPWCLHLSYIKPHWPYIAPAPYNSMFDETHFPERVRSDAEMQDGHPVFCAMTQQTISLSLARDDARNAVLKAYMGLIKQIDDQLGILFAFLRERGLEENTVIVFTSDHGDYMGDHWMGEKSFFHECAVRVPMIIADPSAESDATRGTVSDAIVEAIDLVPTFVEMMGGTSRVERIEGRSLMPLLKGDTDAIREVAISEVDFSDRKARELLDLDFNEAWAIMACNKRWKYVYFDHFRPILFDLLEDPDELVDLGIDPAYADVRATMQQHVLDHLIRRKPRVTIDNGRVEEMIARNGTERRRVFIGYHSEDQLQDWMDINDGSSYKK